MEDDEERLEEAPGNFCNVSVAKVLSQLGQEWKTCGKSRQRLAGDWRPPYLDAISEEVAFGDLPAELVRILRGGVRRRIIVRVA